MRSTLSRVAARGGKAADEDTKEAANKDSKDIPDNLQRRTGEIDFHNDFKTMSRQRKNMTRVRGDTGARPTERGRRLDFLDMVSLICDIYQSYMGDLIPMQQFHRRWESEEDAGNTCIITSRSISSPTPSSTVRGETKVQGTKIIVKRTKKGIFERRDSALHSLVTELRIRSHPPLQNHPNIVNLKGIAWDFEDDDESKPRPLLIEEFAYHRSLETFWETENLVRMPFRVKAKICRDIAEGISALHACRIVHGDIKPGNILIFPAWSKSHPFIAKLTDFGHSVCEFESHSSLPVWTPLWVAPEADPDTSGSVRMTFEDMMATDVYSYGLVVPSVVIGTSIFSEKFLEFRDAKAVAALKTQDAMADRVMEAVIQEDRTQLDSDFDLVVIKALLDACLRVSPSCRSSISGCVELLRRYEESLDGARRSIYFSWKPVFTSQPIESLPAGQPPIIGYRSLNMCSFLVKNRIVAELEKSALDQADFRRGPSAWELCICYFCGFGTEKDLQKARYWLTKAAMAGLITAQAFYSRLHDAMGISPIETLVNFPLEPSEEQSPALVEVADATSLLAEWLGHAVSQGCVEILPDLRQFDQENECSFYPEAVAGLRKKLATKINTSDPKSFKTAEFLRASAVGDLDRVRAIFDSEPSSLTYVDAEGNTALILAARSGNFDVLDFLLQHPRADVSVCNTAQQNVMHFLAAFEKEEFQHLVPRLVKMGADISREGLPVVYSDQVSTFSLSTRCCPLLNAIIRGNLSLLETLLAASHSEGVDFPCRVCEAGSRYRKIVAIAFALHCHEAIAILHRHLDQFSHGKGKDLNSIEIWHQGELIPLHRVPFDGFALRGLDLPDAFLRAVYHRKNHLNALHRTIDYLLPKNNGHVEQKMAYTMVIDSVKHDVVDAIDYLMPLGFEKDDLLTFALGTIGDFYNNPIFSSIRLGFRSTFERLVGAKGKNILELRTSIPCVEYCCRHRSRPHVHVMNLTQLCLSAAVTAAHCDIFFVEFILENCPKSLVLAEPALVDEKLTGQPSAFMAQAIFTNAFRSAKTIAQKYPTIMEQRVPQIRFQDRLEISQSYTAISSCAVLKSDAILPDFMTLPDYVLIAGSNGDCQFLQTLRIQAFRKDNHDSPVTHANGNIGPEQPSSDVVGGDWNWRNHPLSSSELHWLLLGLIADHRGDRLSLWELVRHQIGLPQHKNVGKDMYYVRLAVMYTNHGALGRLVDIAWAPHKKVLSTLSSPLTLARLVKFTGLAFPIHRDSLSPVNLTGQYSQAGKPSSEMAISILKSRGFKTLLPAHIPTVKIITGSIIFLVLLHLVAYPLVIGLHFPGEPPGNTESEFTLLYLWGLGSAFNVCVISSLFGGKLAFSTPWACCSVKTYPREYVLGANFFILAFVVFLLAEYVILPCLLFVSGDACVSIYTLNFIPFGFFCVLAVATVLSTHVKERWDKIAHKVKYG